MADCCSGPGLIPFEQAKSMLLESVPVVTETETVPIREADGRTLANTIVSPLNVPAHDNSAMDGYALRDDALNSGNGAHKTFIMVGTAMAGKPFNGELKDGECIRIMTGAVVPASANSVEMQENVKVDSEDANTIHLQQDSKLANHIRRAGEDIQIGQEIFSPGYQIKAVDIGLLASLGLAEVTVFRKLKVAFFSTGDELKQAGEALNTGDIYESNGQVIYSLMTRLGLEVFDLGIIADDKKLIRQAFLKADEMADVVISSGGVSVGDADYTKEVLDEIGDINFWKVAMKPGKPFAFGKLPNSVFYGLPGNPVSATVTCHQLVVPTLNHMSGQSPKDTLLLNAKTTARIKKGPGRIDFQRGLAAMDESGQLIVTPHSSQGSGILSSMSRANCYIVMAAEDGGCDEDSNVKVQMFDALLS